MSKASNHFSACPARVVSLLSSATEILYSLGGGHLLVGRSHECDYPPEVLQLPCCSETLIDISGDSRSIDEQVKNAARSALSIYRVFDDALARLRPTHILTQVQCDVCAVSLQDVEEALSRSVGSAVQVIALNPTSLEAIWNDFHRIGDPLNLDAATVVSQCKAEMALCQRQPSGIRVACVEWIDPLMAAGNWTPELIELAGAFNLFGKPGEHSPWMNFEELTAAAPDVTIIAPCGFDLDRTRSEMSTLRDRAGFASLGRVYAVNGNAWFNRPGPRVVETLRILLEMIYESGREYEGRAWLRVI